MTLLLFSAVVSLLLLFFCNNGLTRPWASPKDLIYEANSKREYVRLRDDEERRQTERTGEALQTEKTPKTSENGHALELGVKLKEFSSNENDGKLQNDERNEK